MDENIAIIDLGSNSLRVVILRINLNTSYEMIDQTKEMVRLGQDMWKNNLLKETAMDKTIETLRHFQNIIKSHNVKNVIALATAAVRNADNGKEFLHRIYLETGFSFKLVSGQREAYLGYLGVINTIAIDNCLIIDTGGGSSELILVKDRKVQNSISIPYGAVTLTEEFSLDDPSKDNLGQAEEFLEKVFREIPWLKKVKKLPIVGLGGSIRTVAKIHKRKYGFVRQPIHNYYINSHSVKAIYNYIAGYKSINRREIPGLNKERADIIVGGLLPLKVLLTYTGCQHLVVSGNGLREGSFYEHYFNKYKLNEGIVYKVLQHSIDNTLLKYDVNIQHSHLIKNLSLTLFDQLADLHKVGKDYRKLLHVSAMLHDIGLHVNYYDHHYHGFYLTLNSRINGLTYRELVICAFMVGKHRDQDFKQTYDEFAHVLNKGDTEKIEKISLLLKISEELYKKYQGNFSEIDCKISKKCIKIRPISDKKLLPSKLQCEKDFKKIYKKNLIVDLD